MNSTLETIIITLGVGGLCYIIGKSTSKKDKKEDSQKGRVVITVDAENQKEALVAMEQMAKDLLTNKYDGPFHKEVCIRLKRH